MTFWERLIELLDTKMTEPALFGWFHLLFLALSIAAGVLLVRWCKDTHRYARRVVLITAVIVLLAEVYKQINYTFTVGATGVVADYQWYAFPWQFCSTPMYVGLLAGLTPKGGKVHQSLCAYLATYAVFAGLCVMAYPGDVFIETVGINIQTMVCHGSMLSIGIYLLATGYVPRTHKTILHALPVFCAMAAVAMVLNEIAYRTDLLETENFNMFYFSPHQDPHLPVYSLVQEALGTGNVLSIVIYIVGFTLAAYLVLLAAMGLGRLGQRLRKKEPVTVEP